MELKNRNQVELKDTWDLEALFSSPEVFKEEIEKTVLKSRELKDNFKGKLSISSEILSDFLIKIYDLYRVMDHGGIYAYCKQSQDLSNSGSNELYSFISQKSSEFSANLSFYEPELISNSDKIESFMQDNNLKDFTIPLTKILREKDHILSEEEENILAQTSPTRSTNSLAFNALTNTDIDFGSVVIDSKEIKITNSSYISILRNKNREIRKEAFEKFHNAIANHKNTLSVLLAQSMKKDVIMAKIRGFDSALDMSLFYKDIPKKVYLNLIETVEDNLAPLYKYYKLRKEYFNFEKYYPYDGSIDIIDNISQNISYKKAVDMVIESLKPLGEEYTTTLKKGLLDERWVDKYENKGKRSGAYSYGGYQTKNYIMMNYKEDDGLSSVFTLAHEGGHSMHSYYCSQANPYPYHGYTIFEAEIASTFNENLLFEYLYKNTDDKNMKIFLLENMIKRSIGTIYRQTQFASFEYQAHSHQENGGQLSLDIFNKIYSELSEKYNGDSIEKTEASWLTGLRIPHFYRAYYVFQYATGMTSAMALSKMVLEGNEKERDQYLDFLKTGGSLFPLESLKRAGVDMTSKKPIEQSLSLFGDYVNKLENLIKN